MVQHKQENPVQMFYSFNMLKVGQGSPLTTGKMLKDAGVVGLVKFNVYPIKKGEVMLRLVNLNDPLDEVQTTRIVNVQAIAEAYSPGS
jgi:hypothetical protein